MQWQDKVFIRFSCLGRAKDTRQRRGEKQAGLVSALPLRLWREPDGGGNQKETKLIVAEKGAQKVPRRGEKRRVRW